MLNPFAPQSAAIHAALLDIVKEPSSVQQSWAACCLRSAFMQIDAMQVFVMHLLFLECQFSGVLVPKTILSACVGAEGSMRCYAQRRNQARKL